MAVITDMYLDIGGRSLHVVRSGRGGGPAVILEAGSGCGSELWRTVQELTGEFAVTYSYDRAGHGSSDPGDPWSLESSLADLEAWLPAGRVMPPTGSAERSAWARVLCGHGERTYGSC